MTGSSSESERSELVAESDTESDESDSESDSKAVRSGGQKGLIGE